MNEYSSYDLSQDPPVVTVPRDYNVAVDFVDRRVDEGFGDKAAFIDENGSHSYGALQDGVNRFGNALLDLGLQAEQRVLLLQLDSIDFPIAFFGAIKAGLVAVPVNTLLTTDDYHYMLKDSRARVLVVSDALLPVVAPILDHLPQLQHIIVTGGGDAGGHKTMADTLAGAAPTLIAAATSADDIAFWLYSSGSTGRPKGAPHLQSDMINTAVLYGMGVLGIREDDVVYSAAKLFFAYGLGNGLTFPMAVGATAVLLPGRPTPDAVMAKVKDNNATIFYGVPTLYAGILADESIGKAASSPKLRQCVSAGEALPEDVAKRWAGRFGVDILDGIGSTEMLHIFVSNRPGQVRYGSTGLPVPGYRCRLTDDAGADVAQGDIGDLLVNGPSSAPYYWNNREKSIATFEGAWTRTGDKYFQDDDGYYVYAGRTDDMLKVGGIWVSPFEVESALMSHADVLEAAVVGHADKDDLIKPKAFVVLIAGGGDADKAVALQQFVKDMLAPYKYPRWLEFVDELPKTATGKIQRFKLRD
ncbi:MAG: benzoate-CoA ligase family protein [Rhodospirillaceae bacterium]|jgi:4-hydroxybenzoate-CoA ligase/benzoate-CoA ligase|nr:benzoate-CoA ligase family protein [Rhodospirillaceae bacterium]MBT4689639.1 benzoate-CoA ligase family protein [Rhodospirillaceae bacterium]MBT5079374.1 benzoate-CoA ligase family protein [Rhodospirillaceae bacterium]MBT5525849.1 benzoate-CoA ligase family protein [Rhodospirillaceae bacterium]MBT5880221.1 benzoate-CoA ligase family protein [Rhodospirillaceae bacterium]